MADKQKLMAKKSLLTTPKVELSVKSKIEEVLLVSFMMRILNESRWNVHDDDFYLIKRTWFEIWKRYIAYDYIIQRHVTEQKKIEDLSMNQILYVNRQQPGEIHNSALTMDPHKYFNRHCGKTIQTPLKENLTEGKDFIVVPKGIWKYFQRKYLGQEIKRYSIIQNRIGVLFRNPWVLMLRVCLMKRGSPLQQPRYLPIAPHTCVTKFK